MIVTFSEKGDVDELLRYLGMNNELKSKFIHSSKRNTHMMKATLCATVITILFSHLGSQAG